LTLLSRRRVRRTLGAVGVLVALWVLIEWTEPLWAFWVLARLTPGILWRVSTDQPVVALSFDDGPDPVATPKILATLRQYRAHATFFVIGVRAAAHPDALQQIRADGNEVGNHYFMNGTTLRHSDADFLGYLDRTEKVASISGPHKLFRPPGGVAWPGQLALARQRGYQVVLGSAYPHDPAHPPLSYVKWLVRKNLAPGVIVILHDGISDPRLAIEALPDILAAGQARGLRFVSVGELMHP
jgi:peptidoglycan-N-acetylglucosamine deacetylase